MRRFYMNSKGWVSVAVFLSCVLTVSWIYNGCGEPFDVAPAQLTSTATGTGGSGGTTGSLSSAVAGGAIVSELAAVHSRTLTLTSSGGFTANLAVQVNSPEIDALDPRNGFNVTVVPATVSLPPNGSVTVAVTVTIETTSPTLVAQPFRLNIYENGTTNMLGQAPIDVTISPIIRIKTRGIGDANWQIGSSGKTAADYFNATAGEPLIDFIHHTTGLRVIFENYDTAARFIHSAGTVPHQDLSGAAMAASANGVIIGGTYPIPIIIGTAPSASGVYFHNGEGTNETRRLRFNQNL